MGSRGCPGDTPARPSFAVGDSQIGPRGFARSGFSLIAPLQVKSNPLAVETWLQLFVIEAGRARVFLFVSKPGFESPAFQDFSCTFCERHWHAGGIAGPAAAECLGERAVE